MTTTAASAAAPARDWSRYARHVEILDLLPTMVPDVGPRVHVTGCVAIDGQRILAVRSTSTADNVAIIGSAYPLRPGNQLPEDTEPDWELLGGTYRETRLAFWVLARHLQINHDTYEVRVCGHQVLVPPLEGTGMPEHPELLPPDTPVKVVMQVERVTIRPWEEPGPDRAWFTAALTDLLS